MLLIERMPHSSRRRLIHSGAGQSVGYFDRIRPVADILGELVEDAERALEAQSRFLR